MVILCEVDEAQCVWRLAHGLDERGSIPIIMQDTFLFSNPSFLVVRPGLEFSAYWWFLPWQNIRQKLKLTAHLHLVPWQRMRGGISLLHSNNYGIYFVVTLKQFDLHQFQAITLEDFPSVPTVISLLRPRGNFMYRKFYTFTKYKSASQLICVFHMIIRTETKYFHIKQ